MTLPTEFRNLLSKKRFRHASGVVRRGDVDAVDLRPVTREIAELAASVPALPSLVMQSMLDDHGVHDEQVLPLVSALEAKGGRVLTDFHPTSGHTGDHATPDFVERAIWWCVS